MDIFHALLGVSVASDAAGTAGAAGPAAAGPGGGVAGGFFSPGMVLLIVGTLFGYFRETLSNLFSLLINQFVVRVEINRTEMAYEWVMRYLASSDAVTGHTFGSQNYSLFIKQDDSDHMDDDDDNARQLRKDAASQLTADAIHMRPGAGMHVIWYNRHLIWINRDAPEVSSSDSSHSNRRDGVKLIATGGLTLWTYGRNKQLLHQLVVDAMNFAHVADNGNTVIYTLDPYCDGWQRAVSRPPRSFDSVVLDEDLSDQILSDATEFFASREWYENLGIPYRRSYMFYGEPGCGKTSYITALAGRLGLGVSVLSLSGRYMNDNSLNSLLHAAPKNSIILIEDIDAAFGSRDDDDDDDSEKSDKHSSYHDRSVTFSGLINALDGVASQQGKLFIMTTNHREKLDPALVRAGRIDVQVEFKLASNMQIQKIFNKFYPNAEQEAAATATATATDTQALVSVDEQLDELTNKFSIAPPLSMAERFASALDGKCVSMAEVQGHFLLNKHSAVRAMNSVGLLVAVAEQKQADKQQRDAKKRARQQEKKEDRDDKKYEREQERKKKMKEREQRNKQLEQDNKQTDDGKSNNSNDNANDKSGVSESGDSGGSSSSPSSSTSGVIPCPNSSVIATAASTATATASADQLSRSIDQLVRALLIANNTAANSSASNANSTNNNSVNAASTAASDSLARPNLCSSVNAPAPVAAAPTASVGATPVDAVATA